MKPARDAPLTHRTVLAIAAPVMLANLSTPLLGVVDTAVVGQIPEPQHIGAVAVASLIFTFVFWAFGFLRMGTTGLTAQALGARDEDELLACLGRSLLIALGVGIGLIALQWPIRESAFTLMDAGGSVEPLAQAYFDIRIWSAPATLANYALLGWFIGMGRTAIALGLQLILNLTNIALDVLFVLGLAMGVSGVALGTLMAEIIAATAGLAIARLFIRHGGGHWSLARVLQAERLGRTLAVNRDIMIRSLALIFVSAWFVSRGARQGELILAANAVLMHFISMASYFLDGLAFAAEALVGRAVGAARRAALKTAVFMTTLWAVVLAAALALIFAVAGPLIIDLMTTGENTREAARTYLPWAAAAPLLGVWAFQLDGIFIGATRTIAMRNAMLLSLAIFLTGWWLLQPLGNHGLWAAFYISYLARTLTLARHYPALLHSVPE